MTAPASWIQAQLGTIANVQMGQSPDSSTYNDSKQGLPFFQGKAEFGRRSPIARKWCTSPTKVAEAGDILLSIRAPVGPLNVADVRCAIGRGLAAISPLAGINGSYLVHALRHLEPQLASRATGTTFPAVGGQVVRALNVPLAPEREQKRIADKLDSALNRVDAVNTRLDRVAPILKRFRQSVLAAATSGWLTEGWRAGRSLDWEQPLFAEVVDESSTGLVRSASEQFAIREGLVPYLKMNSVGEMWGYECVDLPGVRCSAEEFKRYELRQGDWLFNTRNSVELVGKSCVWNGPAGVVFNNNLLRVRFQAGINPMWVEVFFRSPKGRDLLATVKSATTSVAAIYQRSLMGLPILRPPLEEQTEIVRCVETLFAFADRLEARLLAAKTATERLTPALLGKAFRGELVPQDPNDEPASELLSRLQREAPSTSAKRGRKSAA